MDQQTPNIAIVVREVANRVGWTSGNSMDIIRNGTGKHGSENSSKGGPCCAEGATRMCLSISRLKNNPVLGAL